MAPNNADAALFDWLYVELLWVDENERNNGIGTKLYEN
jgi:hypothetical protein